MSTPAVNVTVEAPSVGVAISTGSVTASIGNPIVKEYVDVDTYTGDYTFTPTSETQTIAVEDMRMSQDITINPIPSNYGLITWNGSVLTVS